MRCSNCEEKIKICDNCLRDFEKGDTVWCDWDHQGEHFCSGDCFAESQAIEEAEVE